MTSSAQHSWLINNQVYANAAARYWSTLLTRVATETPECRTIRLRGSSEQALTPDVLDPLGALKSDLQTVVELDVHGALEDAVAELEVYGPPSVVAMELQDHHGLPVPGVESPDSALDSETFSYVLCWLLEWTRLPYGIWGQDELSGYVMAEDLRDNLVYHVEYMSRRRHLSEGLFEQELTVTFHRLEVER